MLRKGLDYSTEGAVLANETVDGVDLNEIWGGAKMRWRCGTVSADC